MVNNQEPKLAFQLKENRIKNMLLLKKVQIGKIIFQNKLIV